MIVDVRQLLAVCLVLPLAGCFTSDSPLIDDVVSTAPFAKISFRFGSDTQPMVAVRNGKVYASTGGNDPFILRFKDYGDGLFVAEMSDEDNFLPPRLYALLKVDLARGRASAYKTMSSPEDIVPGLRECSGGAVCIDDLDAYAALGRAAIAAGEEPDEVLVVHLRIGAARPLRGPV